MQASVFYGFLIFGLNLILGYGAIIIWGRIPILESLCILNGLK
jgi:hypothetical protein